MLILSILCERQRSALLPLPVDSLHRLSLFHHPRQLNSAQVQPVALKETAWRLLHHKR